MVGAAHLVLMLWSSTLVSTPLVLSADVQVRHAQVRLGDLADLSSLPARLRQRASSLKLVRLGPTQRTLSMRSRRVAERARALMPSLRPWLVGEADFAIAVRRTGDYAKHVTSPAAASCGRMLRAVRAGARPAPGDDAPAPCDVRNPERPFGYDHQTRRVRAARDIAPGETLQSPPASLMVAIHPGASLRLQTTIGAVTVERDVEAMQAARSGDPVFVRAADGSVFAAPAVEVE